MELYILNSMLKRIDIVENYQSYVWTERSSDIGDISLILPSTNQNRSRFPVNTLLSLSDSDRIMAVETYEDSDDSDGNRMLTIKGRSLEKILDERVAAHPTDAKWTLTGTPANVAREIYNQICGVGALNTADKITSVIQGSFYPDDTIPEPDEEIEYTMDPQSVYSATKKLCDPYGMGFRIVKDGDSSLVYYGIYMGSDRTTEQTALPAVVFSQQLDTLQSPTELSTIALYRNVAYVFSAAGREVVYPLDVDPTVTGFERRAMSVTMTDIAEDEDPGIASALMIQKGKEELYKNRQFSAFDGEINEYNSYKYGRDYYLNDLVEMQNIDGVRNRMKVTEQIFASDEQGERSYPTLTLQTFITPGSWAARPFDQHWADVPDTEHWGDLP